MDVCGCDIYDINVVSESGSNNMMVTRHNFSVITMVIAFIEHEKGFNMISSAISRYQKGAKFVYIKDSWMDGHVKFIKKTDPWMDGSRKLKKCTCTLAGVIEW